MKRRIKDTAVSVTAFKDDFYKTYKDVIDFLWSSKKEEAVYIKNDEIENRFGDVLSGNGNIIYYIGREGCGKTSFLKQYFSVADNCIEFDNEKERIIISMDFRGQLFTGKFEEFLINIISILCSKLEEKAESDASLNWNQNRNDFYYFLEQTNAALLGNAYDADLRGKSDSEKQEIRLKAAEQRNRYAYEKARLRYCIHNCICGHRRFVFIVDNMEVLSDNIQENIVSGMLAFYSNMLNIPQRLREREQPIFDLIFSMRNNTYYKLSSHSEIRAYEPCVKITMDTSVDMVKYINCKYKIAEEKEELWEEGYSIILNLAQKFNGKYSKMFCNLSNNEFSVIKQCYRKVLTNKLWILRGERGRNFSELALTDYLFNNISVIRALACGNNAVYRGEKSKIIPNVFLNDEFYDDSIYCLLILCHMSRNGGLIKKEKLFQIFREIFPDTYETERRVQRILSHYLRHEILAVEYQIMDNGEVFLKLTPRGTELLDMFTSDSVLLELYREDHFFQEKQGLSFRSSFDFMESIGQKELFKQLFIYIHILLDMEQEVRKSAADNGMWDSYINCFGYRLQTKRLLEGVMKSVEYSGNQYADEIREQTTILQKRLDEVENSIA